MSKAAAKPATDWDAVEREYRAGIRSVRDIGGEFGCSHTAIQKRAAKEGWTRDLSGKIRARAEEKVAKDAVANSVATATKADEKAIVEANAEVQAGVIRAHRTDITRYRTLCQRLLSQLEVETGEPELFDQIGELLAAPDDKGQDKLNEAYRKAISLPSRIDGAKKLAETLKTLIGLERQAFGLSDSPDGGKSPATPEEVANAVVSRTLDFEAVRDRARKAASE